MAAPARDRRRVRAVRPGATSDALAKWGFVAFVVVAAPLLIFRLGRFHWFFSDDWSFLASGRVGSLQDWFQPHNAHWSTIPFLSYRTLWHLVGLKSYLPYQAVVVALHLAAAVMLRRVARRAGVRPWIATAMAGALVLFGPGADDIVWAIGVSFTGSLVFGLGQLLLTDHDGPIGRRDALGVVAGVLGLMCSGIGVAMAIIVGGAVLLRRGWKPAAIQTVPLAIAYGLYVRIQHPQIESPLGRPPIDKVWRWIVNAEVATYRGLGHWAPVEIALVVLLVVGFGLAWFAPAQPSPWSARRKRLAMPTAMIVGGVIFAAITVQGRWQLGLDEAKASRYVYLSAAFTLPALAVAAEELARRRRELMFVGIALLVVAIPSNASSFDHSVFNRSYFDNQERVLLTAPRVPFADQVSGAVQPLPNPFIPSTVNMGFLRSAQNEGRLPSPHGVLSATTLNEFRVRLGFAQFATSTLPANCKTVTPPLLVSPARADAMRFTSAIAVSIVDGNRRTPVVRFSPQIGQLFVIELSGLHLKIASAGAPSFTMCDAPR